MPFTAVTLGSRKYKIEHLSMLQIIALRPQLDLVRTIKGKEIVTDEQALAYATFVHAGMRKHHPHMDIEAVVQMIGCETFIDAFEAAVAVKPSHK